MTKPGMVSDYVLEGLKARIEDMQREVLIAMALLASPGGTPAEVHERLVAAHQANADMMQLAQLVQWQENLRKGAPADDEEVLQ